MSATVAVIGVAAQDLPGVPPEVRRRIARFLAAGGTGTIELNVKDGRVLAGKITESFRVAPAPDLDLDRPAPIGHDCAR